MKIINCSQNHYVLGGSDSYFFSQSSLLQSHNHQVIPFCAKDEKNINSEWSNFFPVASDFKTLSPTNLISYFYSCDAKSLLIKLLQEIGNIDIFQMHIYYGKITSSILSVLKKNNIPVIQTLHEYKLVCPVYTLERNGDVCEECLDGSVWPAIKNKCKDGSLVKSVVRAAETKFSRMLGDRDLVDKFISVSHFHRSKMIEGGIPSEKIVTLHNFVDTDRLLPIYGGDYGLYFGRIEDLKGIKTLLDAAKLCSHQIKIIGDGTSLDKMKGYVGSEDITNVSFLGFKEGQELEELIQHSSYVAVPSEWYENCPMSVLEAKAYGKPVIGTRIGGIPELIEHEEDGFLIDVKNVEQLAYYMNLCSDGDVSKALGKKARENVVNNFSKNAHYEGLMKIYKDVIQKKKK
jgi:glycosyltransferase involved in cell wall biosynthesis